MAESKGNSEGIIIVLTALGLLVGAVAAYFQWKQGADGDERPRTEQVEIADDLTLDIGPETGLTLVPLADGVLHGVSYDAGLEGLPLVHAVPRSGAWRGALCAGDVIIDINGDAPADNAEEIESQLEEANAVLVRPGNKLSQAPGPESALQLHLGEARTC